jgi:ComF family protein
VGERSGTLKDIIDSFKFYNNYAAYRDLSTLLSERIGILPRNCIIVPVPTVSSHIRQRGYDHTYLVAKRLAKIQKRPVKQALYGVTSSRQRGENRESRRFQASQAFAVRGTVDPGAVYVLVDDIITTGATLHYAGKALLDAGAHEVWAGVIARQPLD